MHSLSTQVNDPVGRSSALDWAAVCASLPDLEPALQTMAGAMDRKRSDGMPADVAIAALRQSGALEAIVDERRGGAGLECRVANEILARLAEGDASLAILLYIHYGVVMRIVDWGTDSLHADYLRNAVNEKHIMAAAWSEPGAGAGKAGIATEAVLSSDGAWILNGHKTWTTGSGLADLYLVLANVRRETLSERVDGEGAAPAQGLFLVESTGDGVRSHGPHDLAGMRTSATGSVSFENCILPAEALLAAPELTAQIMRHPQQRGLTLGAVCVGIADRAVQMARRHMESRRTYERDVDRERLFRMTGRVEAIRALVSSVADAEDRSGELSLIAKVVGSEGAEAVCRDAQRIVGTDSLMATHPLSAMQQDARAVGHMGPPNDVCRDLVTRPWFA